MPQAAQGTNCSLPPALAQLGTGTPNQRVAMENIVTDSITGDTAEQWLRKQQVYFMLRKDSTWMNGSPVLQQFYTSTQPSWIGLVDSVDVELSENNPVNALAVNAAIIPQTQMELNHQVVNDIYATLMTGDSSTAAQRTALAGIAEQCPLTGGNAVYRARTLLSLIEDEVLFYEDSCTVVSGARLASPTVSADAPVTAARFDVYPNTNDGNMMLSYTLPENQNGQFVVYDVLGNVVAREKLVAGTQTQTILLSGLASGVYHYQVTFGDTIVQSDKLIIAK